MYSSASGKVLLILLISVFSVVQLPSYAQQLFTRLPSSETKVEFNNTLIEDSMMNVIVYQYLYNGGGVAIGDINNDGLPDIYFTGNMVSDKLYLNKGDLVFEDITDKAGIIKKGWSTGVTMADVNADGQLDIYVSKSGRYSTHDRHNVLYINNGNLTFTDKAAEMGADDSSFTTQSAFFDFDLDGDLDLFTLNHAVTQTKGLILAQTRLQRDKYAGNKLFRNDDGFFRDISEEAHINGSGINFGLGIAIGDINNDRYPEIFVTNDYQEQDFFYLNNKNGTFTEILSSALGHTSNFSMGCDLADINNDGWLDLFVVDMLPEDNYRQKILKGPSRYDAYQLNVDYGYYHQLMRNTLQINNHDNTFSEIAGYAGIAATDWSWCPLFADLDNDGYLDLFITNGYRRDFTDMDFMKYTYADEEKKAYDAKTRLNTLSLVEKMPSVKIPNYIYKGNSDLKFENKIKDWGFETPSFSNGASYADLDMDGDLDIVINNINDEAFIYKNNSQAGSPNNFIKVKFIGYDKNKFGIGTRVIVSDGKNQWTQELMPTRGYQSSTENILHFGVGAAKTLTVHVIFPDNTEIVFNNVPSDIMLIADHKTASPAQQEIKSSSQKFTDITTDLLNYTQIEENYIDYKREPLLPYKLSQQGPKMAAGDINGDGKKDIFICGSKNRKASLFTSDAEGKFKPAQKGIWEKDSAYDDADALFFDADGDNDLDLYVVSGGNEYIENSRFYQDRLYINKLGTFTAAPNNLPQNYVSKSCVRAGDFDGDGDPDLFIGGKNIPGKYPLSPSSFIYQNNGGIFVDVTATICPELSIAGMINDAEWTDINNDGAPDLVVAGDWTPITVYLNKKGLLKNITGEAGLFNTTGWWNCIEVADIDNDGDMDIIAGNRGENALFKSSQSQPMRIYAFDFDHNGTIDPIITNYYNDGKSYPVISRDDLLDQVSMLKKKFVYYKDYAPGTIEKIFEGEDFGSIPVFKAEMFQSAVFINEGKNKFTPMYLPPPAQWFPINCMVIDDLDGDDDKDIIAAGNNNSIRPEFGKMDAGFGIELLNNGKGLFYTVPGFENGLHISGEIRDMEMINSGGQKYIIITKNNMAAQVLRINE